MGKPSSGVAKAGMVTGITSLGTQLLGDGGLGNLLGGGSRTNELLAENAMLKSEKYTDQVGKEIVSYVNGNQKESFQEIVAIRERLAINECEAKHNAEKVASNTARIEVLEQKECTNQVQIATINGNITALANGTTAAIDKLKCYVDANFVEGKLVMPLDSICPEAKPA